MTFVISCYNICMDNIRFSATVYSVRTLVDGGYRVALDIVPPSGVAEVTALMECRRPGVVLHLAAVAVDESVEQEQEPYWQE